MMTQVTDLGVEVKPAGRDAALLQDGLHDERGRLRQQQPVGGKGHKTPHVSDVSAGGEAAFRFCVCVGVGGGVSPAGS